MESGLPLAIHPLATLNAVLNGIAAVLLAVGWVLIARGNWKAHRAVMIAAFSVSTIFLISYLAYHYLVGHVSFGGQGLVRVVYLWILASHIILAVTVPVLAVAMLVLAFRGSWNRHRQLGKITLPIWLYVSVTGVVIYFMVYVFYPSRKDHAETVRNQKNTCWPLA
ncbi:MAG TPA: DUF420 domain-containing protein [Planctomycetaceae bacterium]|nr:DUF420 domain-containing protein [Planctomycetaceae bacterium]